MILEERKLKKQIDRFIKLLKETNRVEFYGIAKILKVDTTKLIVGKNEPDPVPFEELVYEMIMKFASVSPRARKQILKLLKESSRGALHG